MTPDPRKILADDLMQLLQRVISTQTAMTEQNDQPIPGFLFDQIVALIKLLLEWLGVVSSITPEEYTAQLDAAKNEASRQQRQDASGGV